jgi:hypothetical protein
MMQSNILSNSNGHETFVDGRKIVHPPHSVTFKQAPKATGKGKKTELEL